MLLECQYVDEDGGIIEVKPDDVKLTQKTCAIIVSHDNRCIYLFKGNEVSIVQKFQSARTGSQMRLQQGYKIKHVEDIDQGIPDDFEPIMDFFGGLQGASEAPIKTETAPTQQKPKPVEKTAPPVQKPPKAEIKPVEKPTKVEPPKIVEVDESKIPEDVPPKLQKIVIGMMGQESPKNSQCDYILVSNKLYMIVGGDKSDLTKGGFNLEEVKTLPEGVFSVENYFPRILVQKKKVLGLELWARR